MVIYAMTTHEIDAAKAQLALCIRMLEQQGTLDYNGHCSIRIADDRLLINVGTAQRSTITAEDICTIDLSGQVIEGRGKPPLEFHLHSGLYRARTDVGAIVHAHPRWSTYLTMTATPYLPVFAQGSLLYPVPVLDTPNSINTPDMADQLAQTLGDGPAVLMKSHGAAVVGTDIIAAFVLATYLEENAERQFMAQQLGAPYAFTIEEMAACRAKLFNPTLFQRTWAHFAAMVSA
jgi:ribulose-5-phosphate 4-epimerase/fuculose-1-phosphate aldolase